MMFCLLVLLCFKEQIESESVHGTEKLKEGIKVAGKKVSEVGFCFNETALILA